VIREFVLNGQQIRGNPVNKKAGPRPAGSSSHNFVLIAKQKDPARALHLIDYRANREAAY